MTLSSESPWLLDPQVTFLNHGSFGSCPQPVFAHQQSLQRQMEREPVSFMMEFLPLQIKVARAALADFVGADPAELAFVPNATCGVNAVLRSLSWAAGDEVLTTNHTYNACANALHFLEERYGVKVVVAHIPFPVDASEQVLEAVIGGVTARTKLALLDHISSSTALVFPIKRLVTALSARGVDTLIDGAHAPGMVSLDIQRIGAAYYTGNCHKWVCAPKGAAFLWVAPDKQTAIRPLAISHGANVPLRDGGPSRFHLEFDWMGTCDFSPYLCIPTALSWMATQHPDGWDGIRQRNRQMALDARQLLCDALDIGTPAPDDMIGSIASIPLPPRLTQTSNNPSPISPLALSPIQKTLKEEHGFQVPIFFWPDPQHQLLRISAQLYNNINDYQGLADVLKSF